jgi:glutaminase
MSPPRPDPVTAGLETVLDVIAPRTDGALATYIPQLADADPDRFGIALVSMDGHVYRAGDSDVPFTIQSVSKPFVYALALGDVGADEILARVGAEPSGEAFNAISLEPDSGRPANPLINAGAMLTTSLVRGADPQERFERILGCLSAFAGRPLGVDEDVFGSELATASRNRALAYLMASAGSLTGDVEQTVETYCRQCAVAVTAADLAVMAATLARGGVNPLTGERVVDEDCAVRTLSVMATCGMYDYSGEWLLRVGLPAKSGVAGGLIAASPAEFGIGVFSPRLDDRGNTVRGVLVAEEMARRFDLHLMHHPGPTAPVVYDTIGIEGDEGRRIAVIAAQGDVEFAAAERIVDATLAEVAGGATAVLLDLHRVTRIQHIADRMLDVLLAGLIEDGIAVALVQQGEVAADVAAGAKLGTREEALAWCHAQGA